MLTSPSFGAKRGIIRIINYAYRGGNKMAHWAELDENNIVTRVLVGDNNDPAGDEGYQWLIDNLGGTWVKTSYNAIG